MDRQYIILTDKNSQELLPITNGQAVFVGEGSTKLDEKIHQIDSNINLKLSSKSYSITSTDLVYNSESGLYEYNLNHNLNKDLLQISVFDGDGSQCLNLCKKTNVNNLLVRNDEQVNLQVMCVYI